MGAKKKHEKAAKALRKSGKPDKAALKVLGLKTSCCGKPPKKLCKKCPKRWPDLVARL
jgi:hypothetical protein